MTDMEVYMEGLDGAIDVDIDGEFGEMTEMAVRTFQQKARLTVDGVCGRNTWKKLIGGLVT